jgi:transposase
VTKKFRPYTPEQSYLFPPSPRDWLPEGHLAYFVVDLVASLDLSRIVSHYEREQRGFPPHDPRLMLGLLVYGYCTGVRSSRQIERKTYEDVAFRVIAGGAQPDHSCISEFRRLHLDEFVRLFGQILGLCREAGLVTLGHVAIDGTKVKANASKHKAMSYDRMKKEEQRLRAVVREIVR